jgi:hypothetical protein
MNTQIINIIDDINDDEYSSPSLRLRSFTTFIYYIYLLHLFTTFIYYIYLLHLFTTFIYYIYLLHLFTTFIYYIHYCLSLYTSSL